MPRFSSLRLFAWVCILFLLMGCNFKEEKLRFVIVLVDETGSFASFLPEITPWVARIIDRLQPGEGFGLIGIDGHGFDTDDVRISLKSLDEIALKAVQQKKEWAKEVRGLERRTGAPNTDIVGALYHTAHLLKNLDPKYQDVIVIFSDMVQTPWKSLGQAKGLRFPEGTQGYCFYVNAVGRENWDRLVKTWIPILEKAQVKIRRNDGNLHFYQRSQMEMVFNIIFPQV